ncbi:class I SAM-dependent methyltransferase [Spirobacillus cienkowskii]
MNSKNFQVIDGFNIIAPAYDLASDAITFGLHRVFRSRLCSNAISLTPQNGTLLDLATGTGDVVLKVAHSRPDISITGLDAAEGMLNIAQKKIEHKAKLFQKNIEFKLGDALAIPFSNETFDTITISWGIRNFTPLSVALKEIMRVLKPKGHLIILEVGKPEFSSIQKISRLCKKNFPKIESKLTDFLPVSFQQANLSESFPSGSQLVAELYDSGLINAKSTNPLGAGFVYLYSAQKPAAR